MAQLPPLASVGTFVLLNRKLQYLTEEKWWGIGNGYVWNAEQVSSILIEAETNKWQEAPSYTQGAVLDGETVFHVGDPVPVELW